MTITKSELKEMINECINESMSSVTEEVISEEAADLAVVSEMNFIFEATVEAAIHEEDAATREVIRQARQQAADKAAKAAHDKIQKYYDSINWDEPKMSREEVIKKYGNGPLSDKKLAAARRAEIERRGAAAKAKYEAEAKAAKAKYEAEAKAAAEKVAKSDLTNKLKKYGVPAAVIAAAGSAAAIGVAAAKRNAKKNASKKVNESYNEYENIFESDISYLLNI